MKSKLFTFSFLLLSFSSLAQIPTIDWKKCYGGTKNDALESIKQTPDGGFIMLSTTYSSDGDVTSIHGGANDTDIWVAKLDGLGNIEWQKSIGGTQQDFGADIELTNDGGYIIAGRTYSSNGDSTFTYGGQDAWIIKITSTGEITWQKTFGGNGADAAYDIIQTTDGGYIFAGFAGGSGGIVTNFMGFRDGWIVKITNSGTLVWQKTLGGTQEDYAFKIIETNGGYIVGCQAYSSNLQVVGNHGADDFWLVRLNTTGAITWSRCYGGNNSEQLNDFIATNDNGYIMVGNADGNDGDVLGYHNPGTGNFGVKDDYLAIKIDQAGNILWQKCYGGSDNDMAQRVTNTPDGGFAITGYSDSNNGDNNSFFTFNGWDYWLVKINGNGNIQWQETYGGSSKDAGIDILSKSNGGLLLAGFTESNDQHVTGNKGLNDIWIVNLENFQLGNNDFVSTKIKLSQNPVNSLLRIENSNLFSSEITIYDVLGKKILSGLLQNGEFKVSNLKNGMYILELQNENYNSIKTKFIKNN